MSGFKRPLLFALGLVLVAVLSAGVGSLFETVDTEAEPAHGEMDEPARSDPPGAHGGEGAAAHPGAAHAADRPRGLAVSDAGRTLEIAPTSFRAGEPAELRFQIVDRAGRPVRSYEVSHERRMHLIVVRRDGSGFRHLHPRLDAAGTWSTPVGFPRAGTYRVFADFRLGGEPLTLGRDVAVSGGEFEARPLPPPEPLALSGPYAVELHGDELRAGRTATLAFAVSEAGAPVTDLQPYLGAKGHLVALREGDLAYLHVHPEPGHNGEIAFAAAFPSAGTYRLYLQFRHRGTVRTAAFTVEVGR